MKTNIIHILKRTIAVSLPLAMSLLLLFQSCADNEIPRQQGQDGNFNLSFDTRSADVSSIIQNIQLYTFYNNNGGSDDKTFHRKILNLVRTTDQVSAQVETGLWHMAMVAPKVAGTPFIEPVGGTPMDQLKLYKYEPVYDTQAKRHADAAEIFFINKQLPQIIANQQHTTDAQLNRNVAKVQLVIKKATPNFDLGNKVHELTLLNVPSTITYTGGLYPSRTNPDLVGGGIRGFVTLKNSDKDPGYYCSTDTLEFIIPAHRSTVYGSDAPEHVTTKKLKLNVKMLRAGGANSYFETDEPEEINLVPVINSILRVNISVNDGIVFESEVLPWKAVDMTGDLGGEGYQNWIYVKKDATGTGQSWSDAAGTISDAVNRAKALLAIPGKKVNGILVATRPDSDPYYVENEGLTLPAGVKLFGGWEGTPGTELGPNDLTGPYTSTARRLNGTQKPKIWVGNNGIELSATGTVLDGFILEGNNPGTSLDAMLKVSHADAWVNAVEISEQKVIAAQYALLVNAGKATNILIGQNNKGISVTGNGKLVNGTIVSNGAASSINGATIYNTIFWPDKPGISGTNDIQYSAFIGTKDDIPAGTGNIHINATNNAWFSSSIVAPGPHFKLTNDSERYKALNDRAPMLARGRQELFVQEIGASMSKDINGNPRYFRVDPQNTSRKLMDIGCYEEPNVSLTGFRLSWATQEIRVSYQATYLTEYPLIIPDNDKYGIGVTWTATWTQTETTSAYPTMTATKGGAATTTATGSGDGVAVVGSLFFRNAGAKTPDNDYTLNAVRPCGTIKITTNLGGYLSDEVINVSQLPGKEYKYITGYVGSFHQNNQVGARYVSFTNIGDWEARIIAGLDFIKIDGNDKKAGTAITDPDEGTPPSGTNSDTHYREVTPVWGGVVTGTDNVRFRVGMQSKNPNPDKPRYGLIAITTTNGVSMFFVRQGEADDYLYRSEDSPKPSGATRPSASVKKFSTFNLRAKGTNTSANGLEIGAKNAGTVDYPSQVGDYFQWNQTRAYRQGYVTSLVINNSSTSGRKTTWDSSKDVCPTGYRHATHVELIHSLYYNQAPTSSMYEDPNGAEVKKNALWGAYADGYYDQLTGTTLSTSYSASVGSGADMGRKGTLMVNHYNYGSVFFPGAGQMSGQTGTNVVAAGSIQNLPYSMYYTSTYYGSYKGSNTHWYISGQNDNQNHIGMNCTPIYYYNAGTLRCVKE